MVQTNTTRGFEVWQAMQYCLDLDKYFSHFYLTGHSGRRRFRWKPWTNYLQPFAPKHRRNKKINLREHLYDWKMMHSLTSSLKMLWKTLFVFHYHPAAMRVRLPLWQNDFPALRRRWMGPDWRHSQGMSPQVKRYHCCHHNQVFPSCHCHMLHISVVPK